MSKCPSLSFFGTYEYQFTVCALSSCQGRGFQNEEAAKHYVETGCICGHYKATEKCEDEIIKALGSNWKAYNDNLKNNKTEKVSTNNSSENTTLLVNNDNIKDLTMNKTFLSDTHARSMRLRISSANGRFFFFDVQTVQHH